MQAVKDNSHPTRRAGLNSGKSVSITTYQNIKSIRNDYYEGYLQWFNDDPLANLCVEFLARNL